VLKVQRLSNKSAKTLGVTFRLVLYSCVFLLQAFSLVADALKRSVQNDKYYWYMNHSKQWFDAMPTIYATGVVL